MSIGQNGEGDTAFRRRRTWVLVAATLGMAGSYSPIAVSSFGFFVVPLNAEFGWGRGDISFAVTILSYTVALLSPFVGALVDRVGVRRVLLPSLCAFGLTLVALALMSGPLALFLGLYFLLAVSGAGVTSAVYSQVIVRWYDRSRGTALGIGLSGIGIGLVVLPPLIQQIVERFGWRGGYLFLAAVVVLVVFPVCLVWLKERPWVGKDSSEAAPASGLSLTQAARQPRFWFMSFSFFLLGIFTTGFSAHMVPLLADLGMAGAMIGLAVSVKGFTVIVGRLGVGWLLDRADPRLVVIVSLVGPIACLIMLMMGGSPWLVFLAAALAGFGVGAEQDFMCYFTGKYFGVKNYARIYGVMYAMLIFGSGTGPLIMGYCQQFTGDYTLGLGVLAALTTLAIVPLMFLGRYPTNEEVDLASLPEPPASPSV